MTELSGQPAELRFTLEITRAATGLTETVEMVGHVIPDPQPQPQVIEGEQA
jgi:hypothetical protein